MLKTAKYRYNALAYARFLLLFLLLVLPALPTHGQIVGYFTLTDGQLKWLEGADAATAVEAPVLFRRFLDAQGREVRVEVHNHDADHVNLNLYEGTHYLRLDTSDFENPQLQAFAVGENNANFDELCVWALDGYPGYYFQEWYRKKDGYTYRFYIVGSSARNPKLEVVCVRVGVPLTRTTKWNTWDFGAALEETGYSNGLPVSEYYWMMLPTGSSSWDLSCNTYQRPEDGVWYYDNFRGGWHTSYFCPASTDTTDAGFLQPAGNGALQMSVQKIDSAAAIVSSTPGSGFQGAGLYEHYAVENGALVCTDEKTTLRYGDTVVISYTFVPGSATVMRPFRKYVIDRERRGMNSNYRDRQGDIFGKNGIPVKDSVYYYDDNYLVEGEVSHEWVKHSTRPATMLQPLFVDTVRFEIDHGSLRYVDTVHLDTVTINNSLDPGHTVDVPLMGLRVSKVPTSHDGYVDVIVRYTNGTEVSRRIPFHLDGTVTPIERNPVTGPVIRGSLFGGGRMARVGGNTSITLHNADTIYAVYGGNDIAGWVQGQATIQVGTEYTGPEDCSTAESRANSTVRPVRVGYLYGGGCGYYTYQGINDGHVNENYYNPYYSSQSTALIYQSYYFNGKVYPWNMLPDRATYLGSNDAAKRINEDPSAWVDEHGDPMRPVVDHVFEYVPFFIGRPDEVDNQENGEDGDGTIPYIKSAHITVGLSEVKDANERVTTPFVAANGDSTHWHNDHIVIDSLFGGAENAFIGVTSNESEPANGVSVDINGGTIYAAFGGNNYGGSVAQTSTVFVNVFDTKLGTEEQVEEENTLYTGYGRDFGIRYLFGGGNKVDGSHARMNIYGGMTDTAFLGGNNATVDFPIGMVECNRFYDGTTPRTSPQGDIGHFIWTNATVDTSDAARTNLDDWESEIGRFNVRLLFGGNNLAAMNSMSFIQLHSGGLSCIYGGGNMGDMNNDLDLETEMASGSVPPVYGTLLTKAFIGSEMKAPSKVGAIVTALSNSDVVSDYVFGGCRMGNVKNSCGVYLAGGTFGYVNGGNDVSGDIGSETGGGAYVVLDSNVTVVADVTAGSDGYYHCSDPNAPQYFDNRELYDTYTGVSYDPYDDYVGYLRPTHNNTNIYIRGGLVLGKVTAGGVAADVGFPDGVTPKVDRGGDKSSPDDDVNLLVERNAGEVRFTMRGGTVLGDCFGGGYSSSIYGLSYVHISDSARIEGSLFAGNDCTGNIEAWGPFVNPDGTGASSYAASDDTPLNKLKSGSETEYENAYSSYVHIDGKPYVHALYGSGNGAYDYDGSRPQFPWASTCDWEDKTPIQKSAFLDINTTSGAKIDSVFGGGNGVSVRENVVVLLNCVSDTNDGNDVDVIFGGNNIDDMACVPEIRLKKGIVGDVYGGSNNGNNEGVADNILDACGNPLPDVSTYVLVENPDVTITGSVYGGCNSGNVSNMAYVRVSNTTVDGVDRVYGGNNVSGTVEGNTLVEVTGGTVNHIYGGSNGHYDYVEVGNNDYEVYEYNTDHTNPANLVVESSPGRPDVDSSSVHIYGGKITQDVYGGGRMGDCRATSVVVDDRTCGRPEDGLVAADTGAVILGSVFGGGEGDWENLNNERRGNVTEATHVDLYHAKKLASAKAYGGGKGGDVYNTYITAHDTWDQPFEALYGGSWGSNVFGTANVVMNSDPSHLNAGQYSANELFGGNDFTGNVYKTSVTINSGKYNNVYGGSDGDYPRSAYTTAPYTGTDTLRRPNSQYIELTFNNGTVDSNLYGGGKKGTTFCFVKDGDGDEIIDANGHKTPDTTLAYNASHSNPLDYSYVITNIHGGTFKNNIYAGARGMENNQKVLVYGLKVLNMDGGHVYESIYGGSESVHDGYPAECKTDDDYTQWEDGLGWSGYTYFDYDRTEAWEAYNASATSTRRPSSIINITGGTVENNVYGAGYLGDVYGSTFVNIGQDAIDSCEAYSLTIPFNGEYDSTYLQFKPGARAGLVPALDKAELLLNKSVYAGANWGSSSEGTATFTDLGYHGGISSIHVDGNGYNTDNGVLNTLPNMNIAKSLFGSGTSVNAGDLRSDLAVRNYGSMVNCHPTKELESIQRFDTMMLHKDAILFTGAVDATSAHFSEPYSWLSNNRVAMRGYNVMEFNAPSLGTQHLYVYEEEPDARGALRLVPVETLHQVVDTSTAACGADVDICSQEYVVDPAVDGKQHTLFILNNGIDFTLAYKYSTAYYYGQIYGYSHFAAPSGSGPTVSAKRNGIGDENISWDNGMSGFVLSCRDTNKYTTDNTESVIEWVNYGQSGAVNNKTEFQYRNTQDLNTAPMREWSLPGYRYREVTILAHNNPAKLDNNASAVINGEHVGLADVLLTLPAATAGHYYRLDNSSIILESENDVLNLVDSAWASQKGMADLNGNATDKGEWHVVSADPAVTKTGLSEIRMQPSNTFGLVLYPNFINDNTTFGGFQYNPDSKKYVMPTGMETKDTSLVLSGNSYVNSVENYCSPMVAEGEEGARVAPTMRLMLTYDTTFFTTFVGSVSFILNECVKKVNGDDSIVVPIHIKVNIATVIDEFNPITTNVLAMYNAGRSNTFTRKVSLPATLDKNRQLYLKSAYWVPTTKNGEDDVDSNHFWLTDDDDAIIDAGAGVNNLFSLRLIPSENLTANNSTNIGWSHVDIDTLNIRTLRDDPQPLSPERYSGALSGAPQRPDSIIFYNATSKGLRVGTLDGRGLAGLNIQLSFDGARKYPDTKGLGYVGKVVLTMESFQNGESKGEFPITIYVKTREHGDTIYIASANSVTRGGQTVEPYTSNSTYIELASSSDPSALAKAAAMIGKSPDAYVQTFQQALSSKVYQEGDVIAILDTVKVKGGTALTIHGGDGHPIEVIRYEGHHHELVGESGVYRYGPMVLVQNEGSSFTAHNITFQGSADAVIKRSEDATNCVPDTNRVFAPIIAVKDYANVTLSTGTSVINNWNAYGSEAGQLDANGFPIKSGSMGAISLVNGGTLTLYNNVTIAQNISHTLDGDNPSMIGEYDALRPYNGAVYVDDGKVILQESNSKTAVDITKNYLMDPRIHSDPTKVCWWDTAVLGSEIRWRFADDKVESWKKANVFLTRKASATDPVDMNDSQSDYIDVTGVLGDNTKIGIRKWFPGPTTRDTIFVVNNTSSNPAILGLASENEQFVSDDGYNVFYSANVNNKYLYLHRCATFQHQIAGADLATGEQAGDVLDYLADQSTTCPVGGDAIIYRVQGGFFPYHYTWTDTTTPSTPVLLRDVSTLYGNSIVNADMAEHNYYSYNASVADTLFTPRLDMERDGDRTYLLKAVATDEAGCKLEKSLKLRYKMYDSVADGAYAAFTKVSVGEDGTAGWTDPNWVDTDDTITAVGKRLFKGVQITPYVWADRSQGTIRARVYYADAPNGDTVIYTTDAEDVHHDLESQRFCEGDVITFYTKPKETPATEGAKFIMWDFDPYYSNPAKFVVPNDDEDVVAYYGPSTYWKNHINTEELATAAYTTSYYYTARPAGKGYVTTYNGDVHIYNEQGLAWLISVMNGLNGQQIRQFRFNNIYLHKKAEGDYDMKDYLWWPMGTAQHKFRGRFIGVDGGNATKDVSTEPLTGDNRVVVKNIIINEPDMDNVAFFGHLDTAQISGIELQGVLARGGQYVGGMVARSRGSKYENVAVTTNVEASQTTSILTTRYVSGGLVAESNGDVINNSKSWAKYVGDAVYSGGVVGYGTSTTIENGGPVRNDVRMSGLYLGGLAGYLDGAAPVNPRGLARLFSKRKAANPSVVANNYVEVINRGLPENIGGVVGYAKNTRMENNYVFGNVSGSRSSGGVAATMGSNAQADKNYYATGSSKQPVGYTDGNATFTNTSEFEGSGNQVTLQNPVYGVYNLTRVLNKYVREKNAEGGNYKTWRSDLESTNHGYPLFGEPDMIPVVARETIDGCEEVELDGIVYTHDTVVTTHTVDYNEMVDSTLTATIRLHYGTHTVVSDSALMSDGYSGYGFTVSPGELLLLNLTLDNEGHATLVLTDTLNTIYGCDSVVTLTLTFSGAHEEPVLDTATTVNVYPNPTINVLHVEAEKMSHVEVYDNEGRRLQDYDADGKNLLTIDMTPYVSGVYFVRVHTPKNVVILKVIKER